MLEILIINSIKIDGNFAKQTYWALYFVNYLFGSHRQQIGICKVNFLGKFSGERNRRR